MITRRTKIQLIAFVVITLLGVSYTGMKYAQLDRVFFDDTYTVVAHFEDSGGAFVGAEVDYRGVAVGSIEKMVLTGDGVDIHLGIQKKHDQIPANALALVANRSAVGEQYVDLEPTSNAGPYLENNSEIAMENTATPISTDKLLTNLSRTIDSIGRDNVRTVVEQLGLAFGGTADALATLIDSTTEFVNTASDNFDVTQSLIRSSNTVLQTQVDTTSAISTFANQLSLFTGTLAGSNADLIKLIDNGSASANQLRLFLEQNKVNLAELVNNLVTTGEIVVKRLDGIRQILVLYPYIVEGGFSVLGKDPATGLIDAHFGLIMTTDPEVCHQGYEGTVTRPPSNGETWDMNTDARCTEPPNITEPRGAAQAPNRVSPAYAGDPVATYDASTGTITWASSGDSQGGDTLPPSELGNDSWQWLYIQPMTASRR